METNYLLRWALTGASERSTTLTFSGKLFVTNKAHFLLKNIYFCWTVKIKIKITLLSCHTKSLLRIWPIQVGTCWTHTCTGSHTHGDRCHTLERWAANHSAGEHGGMVPCSRAPLPWQGGGLPPLQLSVHQSFLSCESGTRAADLPVIGRPNLTNVSHGRTNMVCDLCHLALTGTEQLKQRDVKFSI